MVIEKRLYTASEVGQIIKNAVNEIVVKLGNNNTASSTERETIMRQWAMELMPSVDEAVVEEVVRRHVQGITLSVWSGPPGSGKGTNIETAELLGKVYAEVSSQGVARILEEPYHSMLLKFSVDQSMISTGTKGMFNRPEGEYLDLFGELVPIIGKLVADGGFVPDDLVSVLVELMLLKRLTQNFHKIQIDLWPRTGAQFKAFSVLVAKIKAAGGRISKEIVAIKVLKTNSLQIVKANPALFADESIKISQGLRGMLNSTWYLEALSKTASVTDLQQRFMEEEEVLKHVFVKLKEDYSNESDQIIIEELEATCARMAFRFRLVVSRGEVPRPDEFPLSIIRRLSIFAGETSPVFMRAAASNGPESGFYIVSSAGTPEEVIADILDTLSGSADGSTQWQEIKKVAGEIAVALVNKKELIVSNLVQRVGGILNS